MALTPPHPVPEAPAFDSTLRPPLETMPSTPGPDFPGGYPRNSVVFATNKWDRPSVTTGNDSKSKPGLLQAAKAYFPANAKALIPPAVASYFPAAEPTTSNSDNTLHVPTGASASVAPPLNTDGSVASNFSTRAFAGSTSSRETLTPIPSNTDITGLDLERSLPDTPTGSSSDGTGTGTHSSGPVSVLDTHEKERLFSTASAMTDATSIEPAPAPPLPTRDALPAVAPLAGLSAFTHTNAPQRHAHFADTDTDTGPAIDRPSTNAAIAASPTSDSSGSGSGFSNTTSTRSEAPSTASSSPASPTSSPKSPSKFSRFASLRRPRRSADGNTPPPSAFGASSTTSHTDAERDENENGAGKPRRTHSLMRTLRGEAKVLAGRVRRDPARVEEGRRIMGSA